MNPFKMFILIAALFCSGLRRQFATANGESTVGRHSTSTTKYADAAHASRHLLVKIGSDDDHVAVNGVADYPYGLTDDQPAAAGDAINVQFLGSGGTKRLIATGALADNVDVYTAANGQVQGLPSGTVAAIYLIGRTKGAAVQGDDSNYTVEVETHRPLKASVTTGTPTVTVI